ncbi:YHS [uncultured Alphaproteobacteria bacterium]|uniref:YHS n=1 Tax=uncultured Alphaproteobacteria bacterium TaxID=91750 RepID=A0A212J9E4_9PROT|nr:YHS [uncultured Alphaproteobacteria bacterium]
MILYLALVTRAMFPAVLIAALLAARVGAGGRRAALGFAAAALAGAALEAALPGADLGLRIAALAATVVALPLVSSGFAATRAGRGFAAALGCAVAALGGAEAVAHAADYSFTATDVLNTEAILHAAGVALALGLLGLAAPAIAIAGRRAGRWASAALALTLALSVLAWAGDLMLAALQRDLLEITALRVRLVAWATAAAPALVYLLVGLALALAALGYLHREPPPSTRASAAIAARLGRAHRLGARRMRDLALACVALLGVGLGYQEVWASRPPTLSAAETVTPDANGEVVIPIAPVADGNLHRYAFVASDGHRVRFFLINRYDADHVRMGVVFDSCMICGDEGYIQDGNEIICIACNVHLFRPSIGKAGGCNPIPLEHEVRGDAIAIHAADLERGAKYFSEVVEIEVRDPVNGHPVINTKAPFQYEFRGKTFFFDGRDSYDAFRASPETYAADTVGRLWRVQGHQGREG